MKIPSFKKIGEDAMRAAKRAWWAENHNAVEQDSQRERFERHKQKNFKLPDPSIRLVFLRIGCTVVRGRLVGGKPVGCLVMQLITEGPFNSMKFQFSAYNPLDKYDRSIGRTIALEKLASRPYEVRGTKNATPYMLKYAATELLAEGVITDDPDNVIECVLPVDLNDVPLRISQAAEQWLVFRDKTASQKTITNTEEESNA